jgi:hypothetical protein
VSFHAHRFYPLPAGGGDLPECSYARAGKQASREKKADWAPGKLGMLGGDAPLVRR